MRRQTELKTVAREEPAKSSLKSVLSGRHERTPAAAIERSILSTLNEMERMFEETIHRPFFGFNMTPLRHIFEELGSYGDFTPICDVFEEGNEVVVKSDLPGVNKEDVQVKIIDNNLVISGERRTEEKVERKDYMRLERSLGTFSRTVGLPEGIDAEHVKASFKDGVLEVRISKSEGKGSVKQIKLS
jgi:HSP20 family protein